MRAGAASREPCIPADERSDGAVVVVEQGLPGDAEAAHLKADVRRRGIGTKCRKKALHD